MATKITDSDIRAVKLRFGIVGESPALIAAIRRAMLVAPIDLSVLIIGESGSGKESFPKIIHESSPRKHKRYIAVNCGAIPEGTIDSELFGHVKGSFTGAIADHKGYFEEADGGVIFLDEVAEMPMSTQARLLRVLENGEYLRVGDSTVRKTNIRIVAATNKDMLQAVKDGKFREDLYYRLTGIQIRMPALRDRNKDDIYLFFRKFTSDFSEKYRLCKVSLTHDAINLLTSYRWPGNIRQLKNVAETVTALESRPVSPGSERIEIGPATLMRYLPDEKDSMLPAPAGPAPSGSMSDSDKQMIIKALLDLKQEVDRLKEAVHTGGAQQAPPPGLPHYMDPPADEPEEQQLEPEESENLSMRKAGDELIERVLAKHGGKVKPAAAELGISERTIYRKLAEWKEKGRRL